MKFRTASLSIFAASGLASLLALHANGAQAAEVPAPAPTPRVAPHIDKPPAIRIADPGRAANPPSPAPEPQPLQAPRGDLRGDIITHSRQQGPSSRH